MVKSGDCHPLRRVLEVQMTLINLLIIGALLATIIVLGLGLRSMGRAGKYDDEHSEKYMWERVALQALAIVLLIAAAILTNA
jgi:hypothetical protein